MKLINIKTSARRKEIDTLSNRLAMRIQSHQYQTRTQKQNNVMLGVAIFMAIGLTLGLTTDTSKVNPSLLLKFGKSLL